MPKWIGLLRTQRRWPTSAADASVDYLSRARRLSQRVHLLVHLFFLGSPPRGLDLEAPRQFRSGEEDFRLEGKILYLHTPHGFGPSKLRRRIEYLLERRRDAWAGHYLPNSLRAFPERMRRFSSAVRFSRLSAATVLPSVNCG